MSSNRSNSEMEVFDNEQLNSQASGSDSEQDNSEESRLIDEMYRAVSKKKAAFCCAGRVPITATTDEDKDHRFNDVVEVSQGTRKSLLCFWP